MPDSTLGVDLLPTLALIHEEISDSLCETVFRKVRTTERRRKLTLHVLVSFWTEVVLRAPRSLSEMLRTVLGRATVPASEEAFFQRCRDLSWKFFAGLFSCFVQRIAPRVPEGFASRLAPLRERFGRVLIIDGSRLDVVAHRLKILRSLPFAVLPGCLFAVYDLFRGMVFKLGFNPDAAHSEIRTAYEVLAELPAGSLVSGDRGFCKPSVFEKLRQNGLFGLFRRDPHMKVKRLKLLRRLQLGDQRVEEYDVLAGCGDRRPKQRLRLILRRKPAFELLTDVLEPGRLSAAEALELYRNRWTVEKIFYDLKCVLNLHRFYAANPNAVAMQVYAAAIVHVALRATQARLGQELKIPPEDFSTEKLFCRLAVASEALAVFEWSFLQVKDANPKVALVKPSLKGKPWVTVPLADLMAEKGRAQRSQRRRKRECGNWKAMRHIKGGEQYLN